jgi:hypothetical protein
VTLEWAATREHDLSVDERAFLAACRQHQRRASRLRRTAAAALAVLAVLSAVTAGLAVQEDHQAVNERNQAITNEVVAEAEQLQGTDPSLAAQLDLVARLRDPTLDNTSRLLGTSSIPLSNPLTGFTAAVNSVAFRRDGHILAADSGDTVRLWNITDPARPMPVRHSRHLTMGCIARPAGPIAYRP